MVNESLKRRFAVDAVQLAERAPLFVDKQGRLFKAGVFKAIVDDLNIAETGRRTIEQPRAMIINRALQSTPESGRHS